jgi:hypothetical protein
MMIVAAVLLVLPASAAATTVKQYKPKTHARCRTHYVRRRETVKEHKHGKVVKVKETFCVYVAPKAAKPTAAAPTASLAVKLDPTFVQSPTNPLDVTYTYSASATVAGSPDPSLPAGVLELFSDGLLACSENVGAQTSAGTCAVTYSSFGAHTVNTVYDSGTNSATTGNESEIIEPPSVAPSTVNGTWPTDTPTISVSMSGSTAQVTLTDSNFDGATSVQLEDQFDDTCAATVSGTTASCSMTTTGTPTAFTIRYPGGSPSQSTQMVYPWGVAQTQAVTTDWPADTYTVSDPAFTLYLVVTPFTPSNTSPYAGDQGYEIGCYLDRSGTDVFPGTMTITGPGLGGADYGTVTAPTPGAVYVNSEFLNVPGAVGGSGYTNPLGPASWNVSTACGGTTISTT